MERLTIVEGLVAIVDRTAQTIELDGIVYDVCIAKFDLCHVAYVQVDGVDVCQADCDLEDGDWVGRIVDRDMYLVLGFEIYAEKEANR